MIPLLDHWGYLGIFLAVVLGNVGLPVPEETVLAMAGYAASRGVLHLPVILVIGVVSAVAGDNIGYWLGHRYGRRAIERFGHLAFIPPQRMQKITSFMTSREPGLLERASDTITEWGQSVPDVLDRLRRAGFDRTERLWTTGDDPEAEERFIALSRTIGEGHRP